MSVRLAFRLDDPSPISDHAVERRILDTFARYGIPLTVAVVPYASSAGSNLQLEASPATLPHLAEAHAAGRIELALHGHSHVDRAPAGQGPSEFRGVAHAFQQQLLAEGKACLERTFSTAVEGIVPPWNTFDLNTLRAAADCGFDYLSAGDYSFSHDTQVTTLPRTCRLDRLARALTEAPRFEDCAPVIVVVLHPDNFIEFRAPPLPGEEGAITDLPQLDTLLAGVAAARLPCVTLSTLATVHRARQLWWRQDPGWLAWLPDRMTARLPRHLAFSCTRTRVLIRAFKRGSP
jgi:peptidoglycan/xylan/chitin deacetylase (PgdA/CDA1 family)